MHLSLPDMVGIIHRVPDRDYPAIMQRRSTSTPTTWCHTRLLGDALMPHLADLALNKLCRIRRVVVDICAVFAPQRSMEPSVIAVVGGTAVTLSVK